MKQHRTSIAAPLLAALAWAMVVIASVALFAVFTSLVPCQYLPLDP